PGHRPAGLPRSPRPLPPGRIRRQLTPAVPVPATPAAPAPDRVPPRAEPHAATPQARTAQPWPAPRPRAISQPLARGHVAAGHVDRAQLGVVAEARPA